MMRLMRDDAHALKSLLAPFASLREHKRLSRSLGWRSADHGGDDVCITCRRVHSMGYLIFNEKKETDVDDYDVTATSKSWVRTMPCWRRYLTKSSVQ
jgi:hypothetical protein